ncbi:hypothetical protein ACLKMH_04195 [Psychromonas sp. KJ10-10]|uniref:hypothetical protein n=1 Tax=Psychromonas sp. KJ10-10 TaxID=3391823 RepID=UPI0039B60B72
MVTSVNDKKASFKGVELDIKTPLTVAENNSSYLQQEQNEAVESGNLAWQKLHLSVIEMTDMNATIHHLQKKLLIKDTRVDLQDVLVIDNKQLITLPEKVDMVTHIGDLEFNEESLNVALQDINLSSKVSLLKRQAELDVSIAGVQLEHIEYSPFLLDSLVIKSTFDNNRLRLKDFSLNTFSGHLSAQAEALFAINWLPKPDLKIESIQLNALNAQDMHVLIANFPKFDKQSNLETEQNKMPIESFVIEQMNLQNISLISEAEVLPLTLKSADLKVNDFQVIKDGELWSTSAERKQGADFSISFSQLDWQEAVIEGFSLSGDLIKTEQVLQSLLR